MNVDSRGVLRGSCAAEGCRCIGYKCDGGQSSMKCTHCGHPPGKHRSYGDLKLPAPSANTNQFSTVTNQSHPHGATLIQAHNYGLRSQTGASSVSASQYSTASQSPLSYGPSSAQHPYHHHHHYPGDYHHQQSLPQCEAAGCIRPVHCDFNLPKHLPAFKYCSPECRDRVLLPIERSKLQVELSELKEALQAAAVATDFVSSNPQSNGRSSYERSSPMSVSDYSQTSVGNSGWTTQKAGYQTGQTLVKVEGEKKKYESFGLLLCKEPHTSDKTSGFIVVGAERHTPAYNLLEKGKLMIFDVIESANDKSVIDLLLLISGKVPQEIFDNHLLGEESVKLRVNRSISLPSLTSILSEARKDKVDFTHVLALKYAPSEGNVDDCYGLTLGSIIVLETIAIKGRSTGSPSYNSGILFDDRISMYAIASRDGVERNHLVKWKSVGVISSDLKRAYRSNKHVIFLLKRYVPTYQHTRV